LKQLASSVLGGKVDVRPDECDQAARIFHILGGSWVKVFMGSSWDIGLLKDILKQLHKAGKLTLTVDWQVH